MSTATSKTIPTSRSMEMIPPITPPVIILLALAEAGENTEVAHCIIILSVSAAVAVTVEFGTISVCIVVVGNAVVVDMSSGYKSVFSIVRSSRHTIQNIIIQSKHKHLLT